MRDEKGAFIDFMVDSGVLRFGDFVTKSGRRTPYFVNTGLYTTAAQMRTLGRAYARAIVDTFGKDGFDVLFGPAYKGIPLVVTVALALLEEHGVDVRFTFNRKEAKDHGEGGLLVGHPPQDGDRVLIVEDVTTAGTSIRETVPLLRAAADIELAGLIVSVDRLERGSTPGLSALAGVGKEFGMRAASIVDLDDIVEHLRPGGSAPHPLDPGDVERIEAYRAEWGVGTGSGGAAPGHAGSSA